MERGFIAITPADYRKLYHAGHILFFPAVRCPKCDGAGRIKKGWCTACVDSFFPGWLPLVSTEELAPVLESRLRNVAESRAAIIGLDHPGEVPKKPNGYSAQELSDRRRLRGAAVPARTGDRASVAGK